MDAAKRGYQRVVAVWEGQTDDGVGLIDIGVGNQSRISLADPITVDQSSGSVVAGARIDAREMDHGSSLTACGRARRRRLLEPSSYLQREVTVHQGWSQVIRGGVNDFGPCTLEKGADHLPLESDALGGGRVVDICG